MSPVNKRNATITLNTTEDFIKLENLLQDLVYKNTKNCSFKNVDKEVASTIQTFNISKELHRDFILSDRRHISLSQD